MKHRDIVFDAVSNTLTITKAFADKLSDPNSEEFRTFAKIKAENPSVSVRKRTHKTSSGYVNQYKKLTYENMEAFIELLPQAEELLSVFNSLRTCANLVSTSPYKLVRTWFVDQFPKYNLDPLFYLDTNVVVLSPDSYINETEKVA